MQTSQDTRIDSEVAELKEEVEELKRKVTVIKRALRNEIARYEVNQVKKGRDVSSILDLKDMQN